MEKFTNYEDPMSFMTAKDETIGHLTGTENHSYCLVIPLFTKLCDAYSPLSADSHTAVVHLTLLLNLKLRHGAA